MEIYIFFHSRLTFLESTNDGTVEGHILYQNQMDDPKVMEIDRLFGQRIDEENAN